jgi:hypothetical protein
MSVYKRTLKRKRDPAEAAGRGTIIPWIPVRRPSSITFQLRSQALKPAHSLSFPPSSSEVFSLSSRIPFHPPLRRIPLLQFLKFEPWPATGDLPSPAIPTRHRSPTGSTSRRRLISPDSSSARSSMVCLPDFPSISAHLDRLSRYRYRLVLPVFGRDIQHRQSRKGGHQVGSLGLRRSDVLVRDHIHRDEPQPPIDLIHRQPRVPRKRRRTSRATWIPMAHPQLGSQHRSKFHVHVEQLAG